MLIPIDRNLSVKSAPRSSIWLFVSFRRNSVLSSDNFSKYKSLSFLHEEYNLVATAILAISICKSSPLDFLMFSFNSIATSRYVPLIPYTIRNLSLYGLSLIVSQASLCSVANCFSVFSNSACFSGSFITVNSMISGLVFF